jgi:serine phosphatase RsbU (regulator of sigma subunit)/PAS domain-containing protein
VSAGDEDLARLALVIERQRRELEQSRADADVASVIAMARGALMERFGCTAPEAAAQLADMAAAAGLPLPEMAALVLGGQAEPGGEAAAGTVPAPDQPAGGQPVPDPGAVAAGSLRDLLAAAAAERARDGAELVGALADQVLAPLGGAAAIAVWLLAADGALEMLGERGLGGMAAARWRRLPPDFDCPPQRLVRDGADLWWHAGRPPGDPAVLVTQWSADAARAVLGLRRRNGALLGVLLVLWPCPLPSFTGEARLQLSALAAGFADVLDTRLAHGGLQPWPGDPSVYKLLDDLADSVLAVRPIRGASGALADFTIEHVNPGYIDPLGRDPADLSGLTLLEAYPGSGGDTALFGRAAQVLESGRPVQVPGVLGPPLGGVDRDAVEAADLRAARFFDGVILTWRRSTEAGRLARMLDHAQRLGRMGAWAENLAVEATYWTDSAFAVFGLDPRRAAPIPTADLHNFVIAPDRELVRQFRERLVGRQEPATAVFRVIRPDDGAIRQIQIFAEPVLAGARVTALRGAFQDVSAHYLTQVALDATRDQLVTSEERAAEEHQLAIRLQRAIMPPDAQPPAAAGVDLAVRYRPVEPGRLVGGDWYDTVLLPSKELLIVVGDITGHGIDAVTGMVAARNALRGLAATGAGPHGLLEHLNNAAYHITEGIAGTVICGLYDPNTRLLRWARAGHLPPVLVRDGSAAALPLPAGVLLGLDPLARYEEATVWLRPEDMLLFFTDGLIERRGQSITDSLAEFVAAATPAAADAADQADRMLAAALSDTGDDACLVVARVL